MSANDVIPLVLGAGGVAFLGTILQFVQAMRNSAETRETKAISNLEKWRDEADERALRCLDDLNYERTVSSYWQRVAGTYQHSLVVGGLEVPDCGPPPAERDYQRPS